MDFVHLVCVSDRNNNKYYDMRDLGNGQFEATYGRIGATAQKKLYPISKWDSIYRQKLGKGYEDKTSLVAVTQIQTVEKYKPIEDKDVADLIAYLREKARDTVQKNYKVGSEAVSQAMVNEAQRVLNRLSSFTLSVGEFNDYLLELFAVIPRRMSNVTDYLAESKNDYEKILRREQSLLDVMAGQLAGPKVETHEEGDETKTILEAYGLKFSPVTDKDVDIIKRELGAESAGYYYKAWKVENAETEKKFKAFLKGKGRLKKILLWHGSRTENWWSILRTGLKLRPTNAVINGKMFGFGLYFAPRARKSIGYTSMRGACWTGGGSKFGFMALYEIAYGKPYNVYDSQPNMTYDNLQRVAPGCLSLHAHAGQALRNDEIIVYKEEQTTIRYLVELKN